jgi:signal transduction histidine kinase
MAVTSEPAPGAGATAAPAGARSRRPPLVRDPDQRWVAGVAAGVAGHLGLPVWTVRVGFVALATLGGAGLFAYALLWAFVPLGGEAGAGPRGPSDAGPASRARGSRTVVVSLGALAIGLLLLADPNRLATSGGWQVVVIAVGAALVWLRVDDEQRASLVAGVERRPAGWAGALQVAVGVLLVGGGALALLGNGRSWDQLVSVLTAALVTVLGLALVLGPYVIRTYRDRDEERRERIRAQERAEMAARIHDSVLQTLTLVQRNADDPRAVARLARAQERDLRTLLYGGAPASSGTLRAALETTAAEVEDEHGVVVELVCVGDVDVDPRVSSLLGAAREALLNAARHSGTTSPISVYTEAAATEVVVFVRDRGTGFDPDTVPEDRLGVRESIVGRMQRAGGTADVRSSASGTEVRLALPLTPGVDAGHVERDDRGAT